MRHQNLKNNIEGSLLKEDYLEAFLMQSAYIEAVLKYIADLNFYLALKQRGKKVESEKFYNELKNNFTNKSLYELTSFLYKVGVFDINLKKDLDIYREKRNKVLHDLLKQIFNPKFEKELKDICDLGNKILNNKECSEMIKMIEQIDENINKRISEAKKT